MGSYRKLACAIVKSILKVKICAETWRNSFEESEGEEKSASLVGPLADGPRARRGGKRGFCQSINHISFKWVQNLALSIS